MFIISEEIRAEDEEPVCAIIDAFLTEHLFWWQRTYRTQAPLREGYAEKQWRAVCEAYKDPSKYIGIIREDERAIGIGWACIKSEDWLDCQIGYINLIALASNWRGKGLGDKLMEAIQKWFNSHKVSGQQLNVSAHNQAAISMYKKFGFSVTDYRMIGPSLLS